MPLDVVQHERMAVGGSQGADDVLSSHQRNSGVIYRGNVFDGRHGHPRHDHVRVGLTSARARSLQLGYRPLDSCDVISSDAGHRTSKNSPHIADGNGVDGYPRHISANNTDTGLPVNGDRMPFAANASFRWSSR